MAPPKIEIKPIHVPTKIGKVNVTIPKIPTIKIPEIKLDIKPGDTAMSHYEGAGEIHIGSVVKNKAGESLIVVQNDRGLLEWRQATPDEVVRATVPLITNIKAGSPAAGGIVGSPRGTVAKNERGEILIVDVVSKTDGRTVSEWRAATPNEIKTLAGGSVEALTKDWSSPTDPQGTVTSIQPNDAFVPPTDPTVDIKGPSPKLAAKVWGMVVDPVLELFGIKPPPLRERIMGKVEGNMEFWLGVNPKGADSHLLDRGGVVETLSNKAEAAVVEIYLTGRTQQDIPIELFDLVSTAKELGVPAEMAQEVLFAHMARREVGKVSFDINTQRAEDFKAAIEASRQSSGSVDPTENKALFLLSIDPSVAEHFILEMNHQGEFFFSNTEAHSFRDAKKLAQYIEQNGYPEPFHLSGDPAMGKLFLDFFKPIDKNGLNDIFRAFGMPEERLVGNSSEGKAGQQAEVDALWDFGYEGYPLSVDNLHFVDDALRFDGVEPLSHQDVLEWEVGNDTRVDIQAGTDYYSTRYQAEWFETVVNRLRDQMPENTDGIAYAEKRARDLNRQAAALDPTGELSKQNINDFLDMEIEKALDAQAIYEMEVRLGEGPVMELSLSDIQILGN